MSRGRKGFATCITALTALRQLNYRLVGHDEQLLNAADAVVRREASGDLPTGGCGRFAARRWRGGDRWVATATAGAVPPWMGWTGVASSLAYVLWGGGERGGHGNVMLLHVDSR